MAVPVIRDASLADLEDVLKLNEAFVHFLSPLTLETLVTLGDAADYFRVVELNGDIAAFLIGFFPGSDYASVNYQWFNSRFDDFTYIDRVVVSARAQGQSLGPKLYDDLCKFAASNGYTQLVCEYNIKPVNEGSAKFHDRYGFKEIGRQDLAGGKQVSMQAYSLA